MSAVLEIQKLTKMYGDKRALDKLSLRVEKGDIYGLIGPNGAGKTTTFRICATILKPTSGAVHIAGLDLSDPEHLRPIRQQIGYMPDAFGVYEDMTVREYLSFFAAAYDIENPDRRRLVDDVLELVELGARQDELVETLSRGLQQRLGLARVLIHDPALLILDEPASGLDPRARVEIRSLLLELQRMGKTIIISSHILADLGEICNRIGILENGRKTTEGTIEEVLALVPISPVVHVSVADRLPAAAALLEQQPYIEHQHIEGDIIMVELAPGFTEVWRLAELLIGSGFRLTQLQPESRSLERAFMELTQRS